MESECLLVDDKMKDMAKQTSEKPRSIMKKCQIDVSKEAAARLKKYSSVVQMVHRVRSTEATYGQNPTSISEIVVPIPLTLSYNKEMFVWKDSGYLDHDRIIVFATESNIKLLCTHKSWFVDGTFEVAPLIYKQMFKNLTDDLHTTSK